LPLFEAKLFVPNDLFIDVRAKSSISHHDVRYFEASLVNLTAGTIAFKQSLIIQS